jgi:hypothetical protein
VLLLRLRTRRLNNISDHLFRVGLVCKALSLLQNAWLRANVLPCTVCHLYSKNEVCDLLKLLYMNIEVLCTF